MRVDLTVYRQVKAKANGHVYRVNAGVKAKAKEYISRVNTGVYM